MNHMNPKGAAADAVSRALRPDLLIDNADLPAAARAACRLMADTDAIFDRGGMLVRVGAQPCEPVRITRLTHHGITAAVHDLARPITLDNDGKPKPLTFPERAAKIAAEIADALPALDGIAEAPILADDGVIRAGEGYDATTRLWRHQIPSVAVPDHPGRADAEAGLRRLRETFATFAFADAERSTAYDLDLVDTARPPGEDETAFLCGLLTAICRPSLRLAPGFLLTAPDVSGAGSGKGLLARSVAMIAYGSEPASFTAGGADRAELDKRIVSALLQPGSTLLLDNVNSTALRSDTLASILTERPARVRIFGETRMAELNPTSWIVVTGNGLTVSEDLARRFLACRLDPRCEDPEQRDFPGGTDGFLARCRAQRSELLSAALTIWRWGRQNRDTLKRGKPFGSFETWASWIRDPLLTLGCRDPVEAIATAKAADPRRLAIAEMFAKWWECHHDYPMKVADLAETVKELADPQGRSRQYLAVKIGKMAGTRAAGFVLTRQDAAGRWNAATYALKKTTT